MGVDVQALLGTDGFPATEALERACELPDSEWREVLIRGQIAIVEQLEALRHVLIQFSRQIAFTETMRAKGRLG